MVSEDWKRQIRFQIEEARYIAKCENAAFEGTNGSESAIFLGRCDQISST